MKKDGFTLVEVVMSIAIIMLVILLVTPNLMESDKKTRTSIYESKMKIASSAAYKYGKDIIDNLSTNCTEVTIGYLIENDYISGDDKNQINLTGSNNDESLNEKVICIYYKNGNITTEVKK